jgi:hypothetical protein
MNIILEPSSKCILCQAKPDDLLTPRRGEGLSFTSLLFCSLRRNAPERSAQGRRVAARCGAWFGNFQACAGELRKENLSSDYLVTGQKKKGEADIRREQHSPCKPKPHTPFCVIGAAIPDD